MVKGNGRSRRLGDALEELKTRFYSLQVFDIKPTDIFTGRLTRLTFNSFWQFGTSPFD